MQVHDISSPSKWFHSTLIILELQNGSQQLTLWHIPFLWGTQYEKKGLSLCETIRRDWLEGTTREVSFSIISHPSAHLLQTTARYTEYNRTDQQVPRQTHLVPSLPSLPGNHPTHFSLPPLRNRPHEQQSTLLKTKLEKLRTSPPLLDSIKRGITSGPPSPF